MRTAHTCLEQRSRWPPHRVGELRLMGRRDEAGRPVARPDVIERDDQAHVLHLQPRLVWLSALHLLEWLREAGGAPPCHGCQSREHAHSTHIPLAVDDAGSDPPIFPRAAAMSCDVAAGTAHIDEHCARTIAASISGDHAVLTCMCAFPTTHRSGMSGSGSGSGSGRSSSSSSSSSTCIRGSLAAPRRGSAERPGTMRGDRSSTRRSAPLRRHAAGPITSPGCSACRHWNGGRGRRTQGRGERTCRLMPSSTTPSSGRLAK